MASRTSLIQSRSIYVGTSNNVAPSDGNLIVTGNVGIGTTSPTSPGGFNKILHISGGYASLVLTSTTPSKTWEIGVNAASLLTFYDGVADRMVINTSGNVGIGTSTVTSPYGDKILKIQGSTTAAVNLTVGGAYNGAGIYLDSSSKLHLYNNASVAASITSTGNVGIGTTSPATKLHVAGTSETSVRVSDSGGAYMELYQQATDSYILASNALRFYNGGSERMRITSAGNVGIGTTSTNGRLHVYGGRLVLDNAANAQTAIQINSAGTEKIVIYRPTSTEDLRIYTPAAGDAFSLTQAGNVGIGTTSPIAKLTFPLEEESNYKIAFKSAGTTHAGISTVDQSGAGLYIGSNSFVNASGILTYSDSAYPSSGIYMDGWDTDSMIFYTAASGSPSERMRITSGGNVGIGTTSPSKKLHISGAGTAGILIDNTAYNSDLLRFRTTHYSPGFEYKFWMESDGLKLSYAEDPSYTHSIHYNFFKNGNFTVNTGNVGIGTTTPGGKLHLYGAYPELRLEGNNDVSGSGYISFYRPTNGRDGYIQSGSVGMIYYSENNSQFYSGGTEKMRITSAGNVGIGTTSPSASLDVKGVSDTSGAISLQLRSGNTSSNFDSNQITLSYNNTALYRHAIKTRHNSGASSGNAIDFYTWQYGGLDSVIGGQHVMSLDGGNVGVGITSPTATLHVVGTHKHFANTGAGTNLVRVDQYGTDTNYRLDYKQIVSSGLVKHSYNVVNNGIGYDNNLVLDRGNVGIGTTSPAYKLDIGSNTSETFRISAVATSGSTGNLLFGSNVIVSQAAKIQGIYGGSWDGALAFFTQDAGAVDGNRMTEKVRILSNGNVGIGTTSPLVKLHVDGTGTQYIRVSSSDNATFQQIGAQSGGTFVEYKTLYRFVDTDAGERMRITSAGNVGIGTTSPSAKLEIQDSAASNLLAKISQTNASYQGWWQAESQDGKYINVGVSNNADNYSYINTSKGTLRFLMNSSVKMTLNSSGNVGIGTTSPDSKFHVEDTNPEVRITGTGGTSFPRLLWEYPVSATQASRWALTASASGNTFYLYNYTQSKKAFQVDGTASHITLNHDAAGTTQIGTSTTQTAYQLYVATNVGQTGAIEAAGSVKITSGALGVNIAASATAGRIDASNDIVAYSTSDSRLKENIKPLENATEKVKKLTGVEFDWKEEHKAVHGYEGHDVGVIAQEVQEVLPEAIRTNDSGYLSVRYEKLIGLLIESNKELAARVEELEQKLKQ